MRITERSGVTGHVSTQHQKRGQIRTATPYGTTSRASRRNSYKRVAEDVDPYNLKLFAKHRCNGRLDRFELTKAFLREEGGTRSVTEGACATLKSDKTLLQRPLPQSPTAPAPSRREPLRESLPKHLKCLQNCGIIKPRKAVEICKTLKPKSYHLLINIESN